MPSDHKNTSMTNIRFIASNPSMKLFLTSRSIIDSLKVMVVHGLVSANLSQFSDV